MSDRLATLKSWVEESPEDGFSRYALAMELKKLDRIDEALQQFGELTTRQPDYHASYYQYGNLLISTGKTEEARAVLEKGLEVTKRLNEEHAHSEISEALANL